MPDAALWGVGIAMLGAIGGALLKAVSVGVRLGTVEDRQISMKADMVYLRNRLDRYIEDQNNVSQAILQEIRNGNSKN